jgi:hypothetical protein
LSSKALISCCCTIACSSGSDRQRRRFSMLVYPGRNRDCARGACQQGDPARRHGVLSRVLTSSQMAETASASSAGRNLRTTNELVSGSACAEAASLLRCGTRSSDGARGPARCGPLVCCCHLNIMTCPNRPRPVPGSSEHHRLFNTFAQRSSCRRPPRMALRAGPQNLTLRATAPAAGAAAAPAACRSRPAPP